MPRISELSAEGNGRANDGWHDATISSAEVMMTAGSVVKDDRGNAQLQFRFKLDNGSSVTRSRVSATLMPNAKGNASIMSTIAAAALNVPLGSPEIDCEIHDLVGKRLSVRIENSTSYSDVVAYRPLADGRGARATDAQVQTTTAAAAAPADSQPVRRRAELAAVPPTAAREAAAALNRVVENLGLTPEEVKVVADKLFPGLPKAQYRESHINALYDGVIARYAEPEPEAVNC
jgi:hypothetical protein